MKRTADTANPDLIIAGGQCGDFTRAAISAELEISQSANWSTEQTAALNMMLNTPIASCIIWGTRQKFFL